MKPLIAESPDVQILRSLLKDGTNFQSGQELASQLGMSRVAIWKRLVNLRKKGIEIEAVRRKGYRLQSLPDYATETGIFAHLPGNSGLAQLTLLESTKSTNDEVQRSLAHGETTPLACITRRQPGGKGRRGRSWSGDQEGNIYASLGFRPDIHPRQMSLLPIWSGLRLCARITKLTDLKIRLKWPNDLLIEGKKVAGMLAESTVETDRITSLIFGVGINVNLSEEQIPPELRKQATSLAVAAGHTFSLDPLIAAVIEELLTAMRECVHGIDEDVLADEWEKYACYLREPVHVIESNDSIHEGKMVGIDRAGCLLLRDSSGRLLSYHSGDVSLRASKQ